MGVDLSKIRPGDEVTVRGTVLGDPQHTHTVRVVLAGYGPAISDHSASLSVTSEHIVSHTPKALAVGDRVARPRYCVGDVYLVEHVSGDWCWLKPERATGEGVNRGVLSPLSGLERVDAS